MILQIIMQVDLSDNELPTHHEPVFCHTEDSEIDVMLEKLQADASENDYYYTIEIDFMYY